MSKRFAVASVGLLLLLSAFVPCGATELVTNGGFEGVVEAGDLTGWTSIPVTLSGSGVAAISPHSGDYAAYFSATSDESIFQTLNTVAGQSYSITFWLARPDQSTGAGSNDFSVDWDGTPLLSLDNTGYFDYRQYTFTKIASASSTILQFNGLDVPAAFRLDDVSVTSVQGVPEPVSMVLLGLGLMGMAVLRRRESRE